MLQTTCLVWFTASHSPAVELQFVGVAGNSGSVHSSVGRRGGGVVVDSQGQIFTGGGDRVLVLSGDGRLLREIALPRSGWVLGGPTFAICGSYLYFLAGEPIPWEKRYYQAPWTMVEPNLCRVEMSTSARAEIVVTSDRFKDYTKMDVAVTADAHSVYVGYTTSWESPGKYSVFEVAPGGNLEPRFTAPVMNGRVSVDERGEFYLGGSGSIQKVDRHGQPVAGFTPSRFPDMTVSASSFFAGAVMLTRDAIWEMGGYGLLARYTRGFKPDPGVVAKYLHALGTVAQVADGPGGTYYIKSHDALYVARVPDDRLKLLRRLGSLPEVLGLALTANGYIGAGYGDTMLWFDFDAQDPATAPVRGQYYGPVAQGFIDGDGWISLSTSGVPITNVSSPEKVTLVRFAPEPFTFEGNAFTGLGNGQFDGRLTAIAHVGKFYFAMDAKNDRLVCSTEKEPCRFLATGEANRHASSICSVGATMLVVGTEGLIRSFEVTANGSLKPVWELSGFGRELHVAASGNELLVSDTNRQRVLLFAFDNELSQRPDLKCQFGETDHVGNDITHLDSPTLVAIEGGRAIVYDSGNQRVVKLRVR